MSDQVVLCRCGKLLADRLDVEALERAIAGPAATPAVDATAPATLGAPAAPVASAASAAPPVPVASVATPTPPASSISPALADAVTLDGKRPRLVSIAMACTPQGCGQVVQAARDGDGRVAVLACGESMHGRTFRAALAAAGVDPAGLSLTDLRARAWEHTIREMALAGAIDAARTALAPPARPARLRRRALVIGAGESGRATARTLMRAGMDALVVDAGEPRDTLPDGVRWRTRLVGLSRGGDGLIARLVTAGAAGSAGTAGSASTATATSMAQPSQPAQRTQPAQPTQPAQRTQPTQPPPPAQPIQRTETAETQTVGALVVALDPIAGPRCAGALLPWAPHADIVDETAFEAMLRAGLRRPSSGKIPGDIVLAGPASARPQTLARLAVLAADALEDAVVWLVHPGLGQVHDASLVVARRASKLVTIRGHVARVCVAGDSLEVEAFDLDLGKGVAAGADLVVLQAAAVADPELLALAPLLALDLTPDGFLTPAQGPDPVATRHDGVFVAAGRAPGFAMAGADQALAAAAACIAYLVSGSDIMATPCR